MKKIIPAIALIALINIQPAEAAWTAKNKQDNSKETPQAKTPGFNVKDERTFFLEADYLLWRPQLEDATFALKGGGTRNSGNGPATLNIDLKQPSFNLSSGVRVGLGGYNSDSWDVGLKGTYLYSQSTKTIHTPSDNQLQQIIGQWIPSIFGQGFKGVAHWQLNFYVADFAIGREFFLTKRFAVHPFIGLRGFDIEQKLINNFTGIFQEGSTTAPTTVSLKGNIKSYQNIWGVGPRLGLDLNFYLTNTWAFLGGLSGSLLYSNTHIKQKVFGHRDDEDNNFITLFPLSAKVKDHATFGRANLDAYFGLGWDKWFNQGKNRVAISAIFEASHWFQINQWVDIDVTTFDDNNNNRGDFTIMTEKRHGDLSFIGGTLHLQLDF